MQSYDRSIAHESEGGLRKGRKSKHSDSADLSEFKSQGLLRKKSPVQHAQTHVEEEEHLFNVTLDKFFKAMVNKDKDAPELPRRKYLKTAQEKKRPASRGFSMPKKGEHASPRGIGTLLDECVPVKKRESITITKEQQKGGHNQ